MIEGEARRYKLRGIDSSFIDLGEVTAASISYYQPKYMKLFIRVLPLSTNSIDLTTKGSPHGLI